jgi:hypothetical protein
MKQKLTLVIAAMLIAAALSCGPRVMVPPKIDLKEHEVVGIIEFNSPDDEDLGPHVTKKFIEAIRKDQGSVRIVELGTEAEALKAVGSSKLDQATFIALGEKNEISTIITGEIEVLVGAGGIRITSLFGSMSADAEMDGTLDAQMNETVTGASIWSSSANKAKKIGDVSIFGGRGFDFDAENPQRVYNELIDDLVEEASRDFRVTWRRE